MVVAAVAMLAAAGVQAYSQVQQGKIAEATANYNADVQEAEATQADMEMREEIRRLRQRNRETLAERRVDIATSGVVGFTGSPLAVLGEEAGRLELAAQDAARVATLNRQRGFSEAAMGRIGGKLAAKGANLAATGTVLGAVGRLGSMKAGG